ncbi:MULTISPECIES: M23 family metallopeptidase [Dehalobacter]|jgi:murein DD-endopeptidase MepM/ murein hydrolase activator NlpD|uniref:Peptidoglycan DD-metalloendopeptidase family protein n=2 Tax=Dehalobacter restrictus TaxID=55583 RepID=A0A857DFV2_9FIRM|nr:MULTISPECIES: M23 family metallopeptidase [Dehalobacter]AHF11232.1 hypothetical protein DEHRE_02175 [Dehalobacter restrictus DSM 9455]MCG1024935.1 M23 family metallopeptidase [Dehalobacter sp.]QGZ99580.1 peptidoglycan DD-metalloendopeptidase family protein [Dehalobacter restrictus]
MLKKSVISVLCATLLLIGIPGSIFAANDDSNTPFPSTKVDQTTYMPADVVAALDATNTDSNKSIAPNTTTGDLLTAIVLPRSMNINTPKIDMKKVHDTNPLEKLQKENLKSHGYSNEEIKDMDAGDYNEIEKTWRISESDISLYKSFFPELENVDISNWTYGDYLAYDEEAAANANVYAPTPEQATALEARNITLSDARTLLKDFYSYDGILEQSDETLKEYIEAYYQFTVDNIYALADISEKKNSIKNTQSINTGKFTVQYQEEPDPLLQGNTYRYVSFPGGYGYDWFHEDAGTHVSQTVRDNQKAAVVKGYNRLYGVSGTTYTCGNLWGTWSKSQAGAHEGIDYNRGTNPTIYTMATGSVYYYYNNGSTRSQVCVTDASYTYTYLHMATINIKNNGVVTGPTYPSGVNVTAGSSSLGTQGSVGNSSGNHVHFEVHSGSTIGLFGENEDTLSCLNPYNAINRF